MGFKDWFKPQPEQKNYMDGWEDGYDDGFHDSTAEIVQWLSDNGFPIIAAEVEEYMNGND